MLQSGLTRIAQILTKTQNFKLIQNPRLLLNFYLHDFVEIEQE